MLGAPFSDAFTGHWPSWIREWRAANQTYFLFNQQWSKSWRHLWCDGTESQIFISKGGNNTNEGISLLNLLPVMERFGFFFFWLFFVCLFLWLLLVFPQDFSSFLPIWGEEFEWRKTNRSPTGILQIKNQNKKTSKIIHTHSESFFEQNKSYHIQFKWQIAICWDR